MIKILYFNLRIRFGVLIYLRMEIIYSGLNNELESAAKVTGKLASALIELPSYISPEKGPVHLSKDDDAIIHQMVLERANWNNIFV